MPEDLNANSLIDYAIQSQAGEADDEYFAGTLGEVVVTATNNGSSASSQTNSNNTGNVSNVSGTPDLPEDLNANSLIDYAIQSQEAEDRNNSQTEGDDEYFAGTLGEVVVTAPKKE